MTTEPQDIHLRHRKLPEGKGNHNLLFLFLFQQILRAIQLKRDMMSNTFLFPQHLCLQIKCLHK